MSTARAYKLDFSRKMSASRESSTTVSLTLLALPLPVEIFNSAPQRPMLMLIGSLWRITDSRYVLVLDATMSWNRLTSRPQNQNTYALVLIDGDGMIVSFITCFDGLFACSNKYH